MISCVTWKIGGEAGFGIMASGTMLAKTFSRAGYHIFATNDYPSLVRGGHNVVTLRIATEPFFAMNQELQILVALNKETVDLHKDELSDNAVVIFDGSNHKWQISDFKKPVKLIALPLADIVSQSKGEIVMRNTVALGATVALLGMKFDLLAAVIRDQFERKGEEVVKHNQDIAQAGYDFIKVNYSDETSLFLANNLKKDKQLVLNGNEAVGIGAVRAGLKFAAIYPMTPINTLISFLADHSQILKLVYKQPEDEIAGINMAIGASLCGVRSMVATSGGGFALMVEGLSLAGMIEAPLVIDLGMRPGPATGMPTHTEQGELQFVIRAGHGEFPRIVLAPADALEAYQLTIEAFNLADRYQVPVFILTDKYLDESQWCVPLSSLSGEVVIDRGKIAKATKLSKRYDLSPTDGISSFVTLGTDGGVYGANSYEHDEVGLTTEEAGAREKMVHKRLAKKSEIQKAVKLPVVYGAQKADMTIVSWGTTKGPILEALKSRNYKIGDKSVNVVHFSWLYPFPSLWSQEFLSKAKQIIDIEQNATGQLSELIRENTGIEVGRKLLKFDGRGFMPEEIIDRLQNVTKSS